MQLAFQKAWQAPKETEAETAAGEKKTPLIPQKKHEPVKVPEQGTQTKLKKRHLLSGMKHLVEEVKSNSFKLILNMFLISNSLF